MTLATFLLTQQSVFEKVFCESAIQASIHLTHAIMWVGGYNNWTPAEQREWDRDLAELEAPRKEEETTELCDKSDTKDWMELAVEDPLFKVTLYRVWDTNMYVVDIKQQPPSNHDD